MPSAPTPRPPRPPPLPPTDHKVVTVKRYEARPPVENQLVEPGDTVATTKEEEWVTKKTREMTTRRQIATRVQRQVVLEDGKVLEDSGPLVSTTTNEDTETQEHEHTEHRRLDEPPGHDSAAISGDGAQPQIEGKATPEKGTLSITDGPIEGQNWSLVPNADGKVREIKEKRVLTHEEIDELKEEQETQHFGDITDKAYLKAVSSGREDIREALKTCTEEDLKALVTEGPQLVHESVKSRKTIDTEEKEESRAVQPDGKILTESKVTTEHEEINDEELPDDEAASLSSGSVERRKESGQRWKKNKEEHFVDHFNNNTRVAREMKYNAETEEGEKFGDAGMEDPYDWDSLSTRIRKQRRHHRTLMQKQREADGLYERKDALTQKPLDYELEEEIRKKETSKWLEHHFGSDSRSSRDSLGDEIDEGPNTSYFNVTIKSQPTPTTNGKTYKEPPKPKFPPAKPYTAQVTSSSRVFVPSPEPEVQTPPRVKGYFQGISEWSQRKSEETKTRNESSPRPLSPDRRTPIRSSALQRDDSAYVSSSTVNTPYKRSSPERGSPFQSLERRMSPERPYSPTRRVVNYKQYNGKSHEDTRYTRGPTPPERKRATQRKQREEISKYENGYRRTEEEPAPDYSPPRVREPSRSPSPPRRSRKGTQKTRFEEEQQQQQQQKKSQAPPPPPKLTVGAAIGRSIRKLVGKIRSASQERRARHKSRSPSPRRGSVTYRQYGSVDADPPAASHGHSQHTSHSHSHLHHSAMERRNGGGAPVHRYYLGEDPFGGSIYGRENKYDTQRIKNYNGHDERSNFTTTLGRFSKSTSRLTHNGHGEDYSRNSQTLPRKLHDEQVQKKTYNHSTSSPQRQWENDRLMKNKRSSSTINVSIVNVTPPSSNIGINKPLSNGHGPVKPVRTYKALNRSKSFNVQAMEPLDDAPKSYFGNRLNSTSIYKSNPHLSRLDETPEQLKSPGIVSIISRSQRDLSSALQNEEVERKENLFSKSSYTNGYAKPYENGVSDKKKVFMRGLLEKAPELYHTLHGDDEADNVRRSPTPIYSTPVKNGVKKQSFYEESVYKRDSSSPYRPINGVDKFKASEGYANANSPGYVVTRRGSANSDNFSETYRTTSRSDDPRRPSITDTVKTVSKKTIPSKDGRSKETIESTETTTVTKSRFVGDTQKPSLKYVENGRFAGLENRRNSGNSVERRGSNGVVIEVRDYRK